MLGDVRSIGGSGGESVTPAHAYKVRVIAETNIKTDKTRYPFFASQN
jgi:hypothetical protein